MKTKIDNCGFYADLKLLYYLFHICITIAKRRVSSAVIIGSLKVICFNFKEKYS